MYIARFDAKNAMWNPLTLEPEKTIFDARKLMLKYNISRIVIARGRKPVGIVTEKDIARFVYSEAHPRRLGETKLDEVMTKSLVTVDEDADLRVCAKLMLEKGISSLLVVDNKKNLLGIFTKTDLVTAYVEYFACERFVREYMTRQVFTVAPDEPVHSAIMLMSGNEISRVVVKENNKPVGIITGRDLLSVPAFYDRSYYDDAEKGKGKSRQYPPPFIPSGMKSLLLASDVMSSELITTTGESDLADAAYLMIRNRISGLPVVDKRRVLQGIVTKTDVVKALASHV